MAKTEREMRREEQFNLLWQEQVDSQQARGAVLTLGAVVERALTELVKSHFRLLAHIVGKPAAGELTDWQGSLDRLIEPWHNAPLQAAKMKARLLFVLGHINNDIFLTLSEFFILRNEFAHWQIPTPLDHARVARLWKHLTWVHQHFMEGFGDPENVPPIDHLRFVASYLFSVLADARDIIKVTQ